MEPTPNKITDLNFTSTIPTTAPTPAISEKDKLLQDAITAIMEGATVYFSDNYGSTFKLASLNKVNQILNDKGYEVFKQEHYDDGSSIYGEGTKGYLDSISISAKKAKQVKEEIQLF